MLKVFLFNIWERSKGRIDNLLWKDSDNSSLVVTIKQQIEQKLKEKINISFRVLKFVCRWMGGGVSKF